MIKNKNLNKVIYKNNVIFSATILLVIFIGVYYLNKISLSKSNNQNKINNKEANIYLNDSEILDNLKKIILLPDNVNPNIAEILDVETLKKQQPNFFVNAQDGDKIIIYPEMAIVYNVEKNQIIKIGPVLNTADKNNAKNNIQ